MYKFGNKPGCQLARAICKSRDKSYIIQVKVLQGDPCQTSEGITPAFQAYYDDYRT